MGMPPTGEIVARPMLVRACGCRQEFQVYAVDRYREQRQAKFQKTRCPACVAKLLEEQRKQAALPPKAEALKLLPPGTAVSLTRRPDGTWAGTLAAAGVAVETAGEAGTGPQAVLAALARRWLSESKAGGPG
jgi:hypothetical protein